MGMAVGAGGGRVGVGTGGSCLSTGVSSPVTAVAVARAVGGRLGVAVTVVRGVGLAKTPDGSVVGVGLAVGVVDGKEVVTGRV